jgi:hypothetical protein
MLGFLHYYRLCITNASVQTVTYVTKKQELKLVIYICNLTFLFLQILLNYFIFDTFLSTCVFVQKNILYIIRVCGGHTLWKVWIPEHVKWL